MGPKTRELTEILSNLVVVLEADGNEQWSQWIKDAFARISGDDYSGIEKLLGAYGGMGSLNDLVLGQVYANGEFSWKPGHVALNEQFSALRSRAWELANDIRRENESSGT